MHSYSYNYIDSQTPLHNRTDHVMRFDADISKKTRISSKLLMLAKVVAPS